MNTVSIPEIILSKNKTFDFNNYTLHVSGDSKKGRRSARINVPILDDKGNNIDNTMVELSGTDFNIFWQSFTSDKQIVQAILTKNNVVFDVSTIDDSIINVPTPTRS